MNDARIRLSFHSKKLSRHHASADTLVVDELGLKHGRFRADIAVINGHLVGYEIKSDEDSLDRLARQIDAYDCVFNRSTIIVGPRHLNKVERSVPLWWGVIVATEGRRRAVHFETLRRAKPNPSPDGLAVAQLLWRNEAEEELIRRGFSGQILRQRRIVLYRTLVDALNAQELRDVVRQRLKSRTNWRRPVQPSPNDDLSRSSAR